MLTAIASAVAWYAFTDIDRSVTQITTESIVGMAASLRLAEKSAEITATAPALMASRNEEERVQEQERLVQRLKEFSAVTEGLKAAGVAEARIADLIEIEGKIAAELKALDGAVEQRLRLSAQREAAVADLAVAARQVPGRPGAFGGRRRIRPRDHQRGGDGQEQGGDHRPGRGRGECPAGAADAERRGQSGGGPAGRSGARRRSGLDPADPRAVLGGGGHDRAESRGTARVARERAAARGEQGAACARRRRRQPVRGPLAGAPRPRRDAALAPGQAGGDGRGGGGGAPRPCSRP